ncbi:hypothetical protein [Amycolatopsis sp. GM8]|uniref:hypothetical protein n=1 Tax=Amycolatopsis sp. GM8 TaxID=2896530 RepID=UPI001F460D0B|nr:hypothetical protein [Amycolatopsis sp. GM8]
MVTDDIQQLQAKMDGLIREQADRRALHQRKVAEVNAQAHEYMTKQVQAAERYVEHRRELGRRENEEEERPDRIKEHDFEPDGFAEEAEQDAAPPAPPAPPVAPPPPPAPIPPAAPAPTRRRPRSDVEDDDDDDAFLNNRWRD